MILQAVGEGSSGCSENGVKPVNQQKVQEKIFVIKTEVGVAPELQKIQGNMISYMQSCSSCVV